MESLFFGSFLDVFDLENLLPPDSALLFGFLTSALAAVEGSVLEMTDLPPPSSDEAFDLSFLLMLP